MARAYITFDYIDIDEGGLTVTATCFAVGIPGFEAVGVTLGIPGEPSATTIIATLRSYLLSEVEVATGVALSPGQVVLFNAPT